MLNLHIQKWFFTVRVMQMWKSLPWELIPSHSVDCFSIGLRVLYYRILFLYRVFFLPFPRLAVGLELTMDNPFFFSLTIQHSWSCLFSTFGTAHMFSHVMQHMAPDGTKVNVKCTPHLYWIDTTYKEKVLVKGIKHLLLIHFNKYFFKV